MYAKKPSLRLIKTNLSLTKSNQHTLLATTKSQPQQQQPTPPFLTFCARSLTMIRQLVPTNATACRASSHAFHQSQTAICTLAMLNRSASILVWHVIMQVVAICALMIPTQKKKIRNTLTPSWTALNG